MHHSFSGHETFPFRYPWLKKGYDAVRADGNVFQRDDAITTLGVGKNMVRSIRHWCLVAGVLEESRTGPAALRPTELGTLVFADDGLDPYLEDPATLWLLHWQIASNRSRATTWFWTFSHFHEPEFTREALASALNKWAQTLGGKPVAASSLKRDVDCFLRCYVASRQGRAALVEDSLDCPLVELGLIVQPSGGSTYQFHRSAQRSLPDGILLYAIARFWNAFAPTAETLAIQDIARQPASPGRLFKIDESSLAERLETIERQTEGAIAYGETAGLRQLYRRRQLETTELLDEAYPIGGYLLRAFSLTQVSRALDWAVCNPPGMPPRQLWQRPTSGSRSWRSCTSTARRADPRRTSRCCSWLSSSWPNRGYSAKNWPSPRSLPSAFIPTGGSSLTAGHRSRTCAFPSIT